MKIKRLIAFLIICMLTLGTTAFADDIGQLQEGVIIEGETVLLEDVEYAEDKGVDIQSVDTASIQPEMELLFEETYDFESYYMDGVKKTTSFDDNDGYRMWEVQQPNNDEKLRTHLLDVIPSNREGYGDMLRIGTASASGSVFYSHNHGSGNFLPEVTDGVVVIETSLYTPKEAFPTKDTNIMLQIMTTVSSQQMITIVMRRDGDDVYVNRAVSGDAIYRGAFPDKEWIKFRVVLDYTTGRWYSAFVDEKNVSHIIGPGTQIPDVVKAAGIRSARITYSVSGNTQGNTAQIYTDNFRCYKLNDFTTSGVGYAAVEGIANEYSGIVRLKDFIYSPAAGKTFSENFSSYNEVPSALIASKDSKWNHQSSGGYLGGILSVVENPDNADKRALFMSSGKTGVNQYADAWLTLDENVPICFDGKIRITDENSDSYVALGIQDKGFLNVKLISVKNGKLYAGKTELCSIAPNKWYSFNMLISDRDKSVFASVNDGAEVFDTAFEAADISFKNPVRLSLGTDYPEGTVDSGVYFTDINVCSASEFTCSSEILSKKPELTLKPAIDFSFSNFVSLDEVKKLVISDGENTVEYDIDCVGTAVKNVKIIPKYDLAKNTTYKIDMSAVRDIIGNSLIENEFTFKTGNPAVMDILDVNKITLKNGEDVQKYLTNGDLTVEINCINVSSVPTDAVVLLMLYDGYIMKDVVVSDKATLAVNENKVLTGNINISGMKSSYRLRACVWDSEENRFALTKSYVFDNAGMITE